MGLGVVTCKPSCVLARSNVVMRKAVGCLLTISTLYTMDAVDCHPGTTESSLSSSATDAIFLEHTGADYSFVQGYCKDAEAALGSVLRYVLACCTTRVGGAGKCVCFGALEPRIALM